VRVFDFFEGREQFEKPRLVRRAVPEVGADRLCDRVRMIDEEPLQSREMGTPLGRRRVRACEERRSLLFESPFERVVRSALQLSQATKITKPRSTR